MKTPARERILQTANELFSSRGYGNVGINEIIDRSRTAKASFYQHFPGKDQLCKAWLSSRHAKSEAEWQAVLEKPGSPERKLLKLFDDLRIFMEKSGFRGCPFTNTNGFLGNESGPVHGEIVQHKEAQRRFFVSLASLFTTPARAQKLGTALFLLYSGATTEAQNLKQVWPVESAKESAKVLIRAYARPE